MSGEHPPTWSVDRFTDAPRPQRLGTPVTVVVAVHDAYEDTVACLESVLRNTDAPHRLLVVDDASTDERVAPALAALAAAHEHVEVRQNARRRGYTATVDAAWRQADGDVVLLNSDTIVSRGWLESLAEAARSERRVGTVTAVSNAAGSFSVPVADVDNPLPPGMDVAAMAELVRSVAPCSLPRAPTGNGFCMYVVRALLEATGGFDTASFEDGYGEENDLCVRASALGFVHLVDDRTYVYHRRGASYGKRRRHLVARNLRTLHERHPGYAAEVAAWRASRPLGLLRQRLSRALRVRGDAATGRARVECPVLHVAHEGFGGVQNTTRDLVREVSRTLPCVVLTTGLEEWTVREYPRLTGEAEVTVRFATPWRLGMPLDPARIEVLRSVCERYRIRLAHVRHMLGNAPEMIHVLRDLGIRVVFSVHDFFTVCPTVKLLDERGEYCGGRCTSGQGDCPAEDSYAEHFPFLKDRYVHEWRRRTSSALRRCSALVTTSRHVRDVVVRSMPELGLVPWKIIEHGRDVSAFRECASPPGRGRLVALFFGQLTLPKGAAVLLQLGRLLRERNLPIELHVLGDLGGHDVASVGATWHGEYVRDELPERLAEIRPTVALVPSQWPETWCHVLTEAWAAGVPVLASDTGALSTRIRQHGGGWLVDRHADAAAWCEQLVRVLLTRNGEYAARRVEARSYAPAGLGHMAEEYLTVYRLALDSAADGTGRAAPAAAETAAAV